jgi:hypothetical protein
MDMNYNTDIIEKVGQAETVDSIHRDTNNRIYSRVIPSQPLQQYLDARPVLTKYSYLPVVDPRKESNVPVKLYPYSTHTVFNPGNDWAPWSGFNANAESELRNQLYALQKCSQSVYVPKSSSDLYISPIAPSQMKSSIPEHSLLFKEEQFNAFNPDPSNHMGKGLFYVSTRDNMKDSFAE